MKKAISLGVAAAMTATLLAGCGTGCQQLRRYQRGCFHC